MGDASQFFIAGELCRRGLVAVVTMGNCPNTDILCSNKEGTKFIHIQVKTFKPGNSTCSVGMKAENNYGENFIWALGGIPEPDQDKDFEYYMIPSPIMSKKVREGFQKWVETPGRNGRPHNPENNMRTVHIPPKVDINGWDISEYKNRWDLIADKLV